MTYGQIKYVDANGNTTIRDLTSPDYSSGQMTKEEAEAECRKLSKYETSAGCGAP